MPSCCAHEACPQTDRHELGLSDMPDNIEVLFATASPDWQISLRIQVAAGSSVEKVLAQARQMLATRTDPISLAASAQAPWLTGACGVFGEICSRTQQVHAGDRVELYLPLQSDPKAQRRQRAATLQTAKARNPLTVRRR